MGILVDKNTAVLVQGITGAYASAQARMQKQYGTNIVAGVTPGKEGIQVNGIPVYDTVSRARKHHRIDASIIYVSHRIAKSAAIEALENNIKVIVIGTEGIPLHDTVYLRERARRNNAAIIGPNGIGLITVGEAALGSVIPSLKPGSLGIVSRSGSLGSFILQLLKANNVGVSTFVSAGGDFVLGSNPTDYLELFEQDDQTKVVLFIGEIGGKKEYQVSRFLPKMKKPLIAYVVGKSAVPGKKMGHIGAIVSNDSDTAEAKIASLKNAGAIIAETPWQISTLYKELVI